MAGYAYTCSTNGIAIRTSKAPRGGGKLNGFHTASLRSAEGASLRSAGARFARLGCSYATARVRGLVRPRVWPYYNTGVRSKYKKVPVCHFETYYRYLTYVYYGHSIEYTVYSYYGTIVLGTRVPWYSSGTRVQYTCTRVLE